MALSDWVKKSETPLAAAPAAPATVGPKLPPKGRSAATVAASHGYSAEDLGEMDKLLRELANLEGWTPDELRQLLDERRRMAPVNVPSSLQAIREAHKLALAPWPEKPAERSRIRLCRLTVIDGGKSKPSEQPKRREHEPEAA